MNRPPTPPGEIIRYDYMEPLELTASALAARLRVSRKHVSGILNGRTRVAVDMALRLSRAFSTTPELWLNLQRNVDLWDARQNPAEWDRVQPINRGETVGTEQQSSAL